MQKKVTDSENLTKSFTRRYIYNGSNIFAEFDGYNNMLAQYTHSPLKPDDVLSVQITSAGASAGLAQSSGKYYYLKDLSGSITDITDLSGNVIQKYEYSAYGKIYAIRDSAGNDVTSSPVVNTSFTYTGREWDAESGMYYYRARYYDPSTGRFLQQDPDPGKLSNPATFLSKYAYAGNNPVMYSDPSGQVWFLVIPLMFAAGGAISSAIFAAAAGADLAHILTAAGSGAFNGLIMGGIVVGGMAAAMVLTGAAIGSSAVALGGGIAGGLAGTVLGAQSDPGNPVVGALTGFAFGFVGGFIAGAGYLTSKAVDLTQSTIFNAPPIDTGIPTSPPLMPAPVPVTPIAPPQILPPQQPILMPRG